MTAVWLAARLAVAGGRLRTVLVTIGTAVGVLGLLVAAAVCSTLPPLSIEEQRLTAVALLAVALPVAALVAALTRLSASVRDRRLASLRILGVPAVTTRTVAALEAVLLAAAGVVTGVGLFIAVRPGLEAVDANWRNWFAGRPLAPGGWGWLGATAGVLLLTAAVAVVPARHVTAQPLSTRREAAARRPRLWRLVPLTAGTALLAWGASSPFPVDGAVPGTVIAAFFTGTALAGLGLPLATPVAVRLLADLTARRARRPAVLIAARRLQQDPASGTRLVSVLLVGLFLVTGARCVLTAFESTPQAIRARAASTVGPQLAGLYARPGATVDAAALRSVPGVRQVVSWRTAVLACTPEELATFGGARPDGVAACNTVLVARCADLPALGWSAGGCVDGRPTWLLHDGSLQESRLAQPARLLPLGADGSPVAGRTLDLPPVTATLRVPADPEDPNWGTANGGGLLLPPDLPGLAPYLTSTQWLAVLDGGPAPLRALTDAAAGQGLEATAQDDYGEWEVVVGYRALLWTVAAAILGLGLLALLVTGVDRAVERRRHLASLTLVGVPVSLIRRSQLLQATAPLAVGLPVAAGAGLLAGRSFLGFASPFLATPWPAALAATGIAVAGGLVVAAATVAGLGRAPGPADLRRE